MSDYKDLIYDKACFKASHNSYERDEIPVVDQFKWNPRKTHDAGCRGIELDIQQSSHNWSWSVSHIGGYSGGVDVQFSTYLELLAAWSVMNKGHDVISVMLDIKATDFDDKDFPAFFDQYLARYFPVERIFQPGELFRPGLSLADSVKQGWPLLNDMRDKFIFCFSGNEDRKSKYATTAPRRRLCFADKKGSLSKATKVGDGSRIFFNFKLSEAYFEGRNHDDMLSTKDTRRLTGSIEKLRSHGGLIIRGYDLNSGKSWKNAKKLGVNMLSTDKVRKYSWAKAGKKPFTAI